MTANVTSHKLHVIKECYTNSNCSTFQNLNNFNIFPEFLTLGMRNMVTSYDSSSNNTQVIPLWFTVLLTDIWSTVGCMKQIVKHVILQKVVKECLNIKNKYLPYDIRVQSYNTTAPMHKYLSHNGRYFLQLFV